MLITTDNLSKSYGKLPALRGLDLRVELGKTHGLELPAKDTLVSRTAASLGHPGIPQQDVTL